MSAPEVLAAKTQDVIFGDRVKIVEPCNLYGCDLGDDVFVGPFVEIQSDVIVGDRTKVQSHSFVCSLVSIGFDCFIGHGVMFVNDTLTGGGPAKGDRSKWKETIVGNNVSIGSNATILPVSICDRVVIGAGAVVTKNIEKSGIYVGNPAKFVRVFE
jgi:acetyltransferase-like isoleucine patch superfamily enzyme